MTLHTAGRAKEQQRPFLLICGERILLAARILVNRRVGKDQTELEFRNRLAEHVEVDGCAVLDFPKDFPEEFAVGGYSVQAAEHLGADGIIVARKTKARHLHPLGRRNKGLRVEQVRQVRQGQALRGRKSKSCAVIEWVAGERGKARVPHQIRKESCVDRHRRAPMAINTAFFPNLMWNSRFAALSGDPFDNGAGFRFPPPEGLTLSYLPHLLDAQAFIPPTERVEVAGFSFPGDNYAIRAEVLRRLNAIAAYRKLFGEVFREVKDGAPIDLDMFGKAIAEFEFSLVFADAPIDEYARGQKNALTTDQKKGALLFFGTAGCVECHQVSGSSNEMFSDFTQHVIGVPQIAPVVGVPTAGNVVFDGPAQNEDFGLEQITDNINDRYKFRTSPIRNVALQPSFFHNGAFTRLEDAIRHHLGVVKSVNNYDPAAAGVAPDLSGPLGPMEGVLARLDPLLTDPSRLTDEEFRQLVDFVRDGLLDPRARPERLRTLVPKAVPSGRPVLIFEFP